MRIYWMGAACAMLCACSKEPPSVARQALGALAPFRVKDINTNLLPRDSSPQEFVQLGGSVFFTASTDRTGVELWKSDGTSAGTVLVRDINPGPSLSFTRMLTVMGSALYFKADDSNGYGLWRSDGTPAGTVMLKRFYDFDELVRVGSTLFFSARTSNDDDIELWKSDGTTAGTVRVKDIVPGSGGSGPSSLVAMGGALYFWASGATTQTYHSLWTSDGSEGGTVQVKEFGSGNDNHGPLLVVGSTLFFRARAGAGTDGYELWKSNGQDSGTVMVKDIKTGASADSFPEQMVAFNGGVLFAADDGTHGKELWISNGEESGTTLVKDIDADAEAGFDGNPPVASGTYAYFTARDGTGTNGLKLWRTDGTLTETKLVKDFNPDGVSIGGMVDLGGTLYFTVDDGTNGPELWKTDGSTNGTVLVKEIAGSAGLSAYEFRNLGGTLWFQANDGTTGVELWKSDGSTNGSVRVADIAPARAASNPEQLVNAGGTLFFVARDGNSDRELWKSDGTEAGTVRVKDIRSGASSDPDELVALGNQVLFWADDGTSGIELWKSDGSEAGTVRVKDIYPGATGSEPYLLTVLGGVVYFGARDNTGGVELWKSDGSESGTVRIKDAYPGTPGGSPDFLTVVGDKLYFVGRDNTNEFELWISDGTENGTSMVKNINASGSASIRDITNVNGTAYFIANDGSGAALWKSNGTDATTMPVGSPAPQPNHSLFAVGSTLFYRSSDSENRELWKTSGGVPVMVKDINPGATAESRPDWGIGFGGKGYFWAFEPSVGLELWKTDGSESGTIPVADIAPGILSSTSRDINDPLRPLAIAPGGPLLFAASDGTRGYEPWISDGTASGTQLLADVAPGAMPSNATRFTVAGNFLFFNADDGSGPELWALSLAPPKVTCPANLTVEATSSSGATVSYDPATVEDYHITAPAIAYDKNSGAVFAIGATPVTASATDAIGKTGSCSFTVTVRDTTPPAITCPANQNAESSDGVSAIVSYPGAAVSDAISTPTLVYSQAAGTSFAVGATTVMVTASDGAGNMASCSFTVTVTAAPAPGDDLASAPDLGMTGTPKGDCSCRLAPASGPPAGAWLLLLSIAIRLRRRRG